jgi:hypothetical protein
MYDNISYIKKDNKPNAGPIQNNLSFNGPTILNNSRINQAINYSNVNDSIFETVNKLLFEIKDIKSIDNKIVKDLEQAEKSKSKSKLVDLLVGIASNSTSSILLYSAKGILASLGIFI